MKYIAEMYNEIQTKMDEIQAQVEADNDLAARMTFEEHEQFTIEQRAQLLKEYFEARKKEKTTARVEAIRNKPATRAQLRNLMMTYLKHTCSYKHHQLNKKT